MTLGHLVYGMSYFDFICTGLEANQMPKNDALGYGIKHRKMNEWSREDSSPHSDLRGYISFVPSLYWLKSFLRRFWEVNIEAIGLMWIKFESRHYAELSIYLRYMMKGLNYTEILYTERLIKPIDLLNIEIVMMAC